MASMIIGLSFLLSVTLGAARYKVLILLPTTIIAALGVAVAGIELGYQFWHLVLVIILTGTAIQFGYLIGTIGHAMVMHSMRKRSVGIPHAEVTRRGAVAALSDGDAVPTAPSVISAETDHCPREDAGGVEAQVDAEGVPLVPSPRERADVQQPSHHRMTRTRRIATGFLTLIVSRDGSDR
jgi:hypothetical protein